MRTIPVISLALALAAPPGTFAAATGALAGRVLPGTGGRLEATRVWVAPGASPGPALPAKVAVDGSFRLDGIPTGPVELAIETSEGLYVVDAPVAIAPGMTRSLRVVLGGREDTKTPAGPAEKDKQKRRGAVWSNPATATLIVIGAAIVVGVAIDQLTKSNDVPVSPSSQ
jgi:hypothetical protein